MLNRRTLLAAVPVLTATKGKAMTVHPTPEERELEAAETAIAIAQRVMDADRYMREVERNLTKACGNDKLGELVHQLLIVCPMWAREWAANVTP